MHKFRRLYWFIRHQVFVSANSKFVSNNSIFRDCKVRVSTNSQFILGKNCLIENCNINLAEGASFVIGENTILRNARLDINSSSFHVGVNSALSDAKIQITNSGKLVLGDDCVVERGDSWRGSIWNITDGSKLKIEHHNRIRCDIFMRFKSCCIIGCYNCINEETEIRVDEKLLIGDYNMISYRCRIWDTDTHTFYHDNTRRKMTEMMYPNIGAERHKPITKPIEIGSDNLIGEYAAVLKGSKIGNRCKVGFRAIVSNSDIADGTTYVNKPNK
jgi:acetyltransferase-like isoleucine patch superfamily enzyme